MHFKRYKAKLYVSIIVALFKSESHTDAALLDYLSKSLNSRTKNVETCYFKDLRVSRHIIRLVKYDQVIRKSQSLSFSFIERLKYTGDLDILIPVL